ncbi:MAG: phosphatase [Enterobacteriaceae bacterium]|jgi:putative hydrolase|nr:phosphatase [Enterobacteriaceae bacterium]
MYPVDLHTHTVASTHAYSTVSEYFTIAKEKGIQLFAVTDHGPELVDAPHPWHFQNMAVIPRMINGVGLLYGIEANIKNLQGDTDCYDEILPHMDIVIAGFHDPVMPSQGLVGNTQALIATIASGKVQMISHPGNPKFPIDIAAVASAAAKYNVALEINNSSFIHSRLGSEKNCIAVAKAVRDTGGLLALGSDSHIAYSLGGFDKALEVIKQVGFPEDRILNVTPRRVLNFLESHGRPSIAELASL